MPEQPTTDDRAGLTSCPGCGSLLPAVDGPIHPYIGASAACWALYGQVLAIEAGTYRQPAWHRLTVDAYAVQHPGVPERRSVQSVCVHLISLCLVLEHDIPPNRATQLLGTVLARRPAFVWLAPPSSLGRLTVRHVLSAANREDHERHSWAWAGELWASWGAHHEQIRLWTDNALR